jgi:hypothetical protein
MHHSVMSKVLVLFVGVAMTWGLVLSLGWMALAGCFIVALATVMFSLETDEQELSGVAVKDYSAVPSSPVGSF